MQNIVTGKSKYIDLCSRIFISIEDIEFIDCPALEERYKNTDVIGIRLDEESPDESISEKIDKAIDKINSKKAEVMPKLERVLFSIKNIEQYAELVKYLEENKGINYEVIVRFTDKNISLEEVAKVACSKTWITTPFVNYENITRVDKESRKNLYFIASRMILSNPDFLDFEVLLDYIDQVAEEISKYAKNDIQKILLLERFIDKTFKYDHKFKKKDDIELLENPSRTVQGLVKNKKGVCGAISLFAAIVLNHPKLNVKTRTCSGENHGWNEIMIDEKYYSYDFTSNMSSRIYVALNFYAFANKGCQFIIDRTGSKRITEERDKFFEGIRSFGLMGDIFVKKISLANERIDYNPKTNKREDIGFDKYSSMPAAEILKEYDEIKDVDIAASIKIPTK